MIDRVARLLPWLVLLYFAVHVVSRVMVSPVLLLDEAEQALVAQQSWQRMSYAGQPPMYTWLQKAFFHVLGVNVSATALLKNALLALVYLFTWRAARRVTADRAAAALAAMSLLLVVQFAWEAQRHQTHMVLVSAATAASAWAMLRCVLVGRRADFVLLGAAMTVGLLAKYNFAFAAAGMTLAAMSISSFRRRLSRPASLIPLGAVVAVAGAQLAWLANHPEAVRKADQLAFDTGYNLFTPLLGGAEVLVNVALFLGPTALLYVLLVRASATGHANRAPQAQPDALAFLARTAIIAGLLVLAVILAIGATEWRSRWMQPVLWSAVPAIALWAGPKLDATRMKLAMGICAAVALVVLVLLPARTVFGPAWGDPNTLNQPAPTWALRLREAGFERGLIVSDSVWLAGNLLAQFPHSSAVVPPIIEPASVKTVDGPMLIAWKTAPDRDGPAPNLADWLSRHAPQSLDQRPVSVVAPLLYSDDLTQAIQYVLVPRPTRSP